MTALVVIVAVCGVKLIAITSDVLFINISNQVKKSSSKTFESKTVFWVMYLEYKIVPLFVIAIVPFPFASWIALLATFIKVGAAD